MVYFRRYRPMIVMAYTGFNLAVSIILFVLAIVKKLNMIVCFSMIFTSVKKVKDILKYLDQDTIKKHNELTEAARKSLGKTHQSLGSLSSHHFRILYANAISLQNRVIALERALERNGNSNGSDIDSLATTSHFDVFQSRESRECTRF